MDGFEAEVHHLLSGQLVSDAAIDVECPGEANYVPVTKDTVCYIVCGVLFNERNEVLMMQEAKPSCYGRWYLPAGRMEVNENMEDAVKREVLEETGIKFKPSTLLCVEVASCYWYRFTFTGHVTGGSLKKHEQRDKESLQAKWCRVSDVKSNMPSLPLRALDILPLIEMGAKFQGLEGTSRHPDTLPAIKPHFKLLLRTLMVCTNESKSDIQVLVGKSGIPHIPLGQISHLDAQLHVVVFRIIQDAFGSSSYFPNISGVLSIEHCGKPAKVHDGTCISLLISITTKEKSLPPIDNPAKYEWHPVQGELKKAIAGRLEKGRTVSLMLLR